MRAYTIWLNYGTEGWKPQEPMTAQEVQDWILKDSNVFRCQEYRVTIDALPRVELRPY